MEERDHRASSEEIIKEREREREREGEREGRMIREKKSQTISERLKRVARFHRHRSNLKTRGIRRRKRARDHRARKKSIAFRAINAFAFNARAKYIYTHL
jgi:hypothetical protein